MNHRFRPAVAMATLALAVGISPALAAPPAPIVATPGSALSSVAYNDATFEISADGHVHALMRNGSGWAPIDITNMVNGATAVPGSALSSALVSASSGQVAVFYLSADGHVHVLTGSLAGSPWRHVDVTAISGAPVAMPGTGLTSVALLGSQPGSHLRTYYVSAAGHVEELGDSSGPGGSWGVADITATSGGLAASATPLTSMVCVEGGALYPHVFHFTDGGGVQELASKGGWHATDLMAASGGVAAVAGSAITSVCSNTQGPRIYYFDADQHVREYAWSNAWLASDITSRAGASAAVGGSALTSYQVGSGGNSRVYYLTYDGHVQELAWGNGWTWSASDIVARAGAVPAAAGSALSSFGSSTNAVFYVSPDSHVRELVWNGAWTARDANGPQ
jgi:hypothetical protein